MEMSALKNFIGISLIVVALVTASLGWLIPEAVVQALPAMVERTGFWGLSILAILPAGYGAFLLSLPTNKEVQFVLSKA